MATGVALIILVGLVWVLVGVVLTRLRGDEDLGDRVLHDRLLAGNRLQPQLFLVDWSVLAVRWPARTGELRC